MANLLGIVNQQQTPSIDEEKLKIFCSRTNVWDHFGLERDVFSILPEDKQMQLIRKFYFDHLPKSNNSAFNIDPSIGSAIRNSAGLSMKKVIENREDRTEVSFSTINGDEKVKRSIQLWEDFGYFRTESCNFSIEKANLPENTIFYINQGYQSFKDNKKVYYNDVYIIAQIMPFHSSPKISKTMS